MRDRIREDLLGKNGSPVITQICVGAELIGGATEVMAAGENGQLQQLLDRHQVSYNRDRQVTAAEFLPNWVAK